MNYKKQSIAIVTLNGYHNYGNRLQNYALQTALEHKGYKVDTLIFDEIECHETLFEKYLRRVQGTLRIKNNYIITKLFIKKSSVAENYNLKQKKQILFDFTKKYIHERHIDSNSFENLKIVNENYDYFIIGSDQIWNPDYFIDYHLNFATYAESSKRIVYAASIGKTELNFWEKYIFRKGLINLNMVSLREKSGQKLLEKLVGFKYDIVLDPTLLLSEEEWSELLPLNETLSTYVLTYFLTDISKEISDQIIKYASSRNYDILDLSSKEKTYSPIEFLQLIQNAKMVFTDSFHGTVFSIIFCTPFYVFQRSDRENGMYDRIETLLETVGLQNRQSPAKGIEYDEHCNFTHTKVRLEIEREESLNYLLKSLGRNTYDIRE